MADTEASESADTTPAENTNSDEAPGDNESAADSKPESDGTQPQDSSAPEDAGEAEDAEEDGRKKSEADEGRDSAAEEDAEDTEAAPEDTSETAGADDAGPVEDKPFDYDLVMKNALHGKMDFQYPQISRVVRVYIQSAGSDTLAERAAIRKKVYPKLRQYCKERGYELQFVDLRSCEQDELTDEHVLEKIAVQEIQKCRTLSAGPNFILLLGQKLGSKCPPVQIPVNELKKLVKVAEDDDDLLSQWYELDENVYPPAYVLVPVSTRIKEYNNGYNQEAVQEWRETKAKLASILIEASSEALVEKEKAKYRNTRVEEEIRIGTAGEQICSGLCHWFKRDIGDLVDNVEDEDTDTYIDREGGHVDGDKDTRLQTLSETLENKLSESSISSYSVTWDDLRDRGQGYETYIDTVCKDFEQVLKSKISEAIASRFTIRPKDGRIAELIRHVCHAQQYESTFVGRDDILETIKKAVTKDTDRAPVILTGEPGTGKSAVLAKLAAEIPGWMGEDEHAVIIRFQEIMSVQTNQRLLTSLCRQIHGINGHHKLIPRIPKDMEKLPKYFLHILKKQAELKKTVCVLLDCLQCMGDDNNNTYSWIPKALPKCTALVMTLASDDPSLERLKKQFASTTFEIPDLIPEDMTQLLHGSLKSYQRALQPDQWEVLEQLCPQQPTPFFMNMVINTARAWRSSDAVENCKIPDAVDDIMKEFFTALEQTHGEVFVKATLGYLAAAKAGLSFCELHDLLSTHQDIPSELKADELGELRTLPLIHVLQSVGYYLKVQHTEGILLIQYRNQMIHNAARERYLTESTREAFSISIRNYFLGKQEPPTDGQHSSPQPYILESEDGTSLWYNTRKLLELPYQLSVMNQTEDLNRMYKDINFLQAKLATTSLESLLEDMSSAFNHNIDDEVLEALRGCMQKYSEALSEDSGFLACCVIQEFKKPDSEISPAMLKILDQARNPDFSCLLTSQFRVAINIDEAKLGKYSGHTAPIQNLDLSNDSLKCLTVAEDNTLRVWEIEEMKEVHCIDLSSEEPYLTCKYLPIARFCNNDQWVVLASITVLNFLDLAEESAVHRIELADDGPLHIAFIHDMNQILAAQNSEISVWDIQTGDKVTSLFSGKPVEISDETHKERVEDYIHTHGTDVIFHRGGSNVVKVIHYTSEKKTDTYAMFGKKEGIGKVCRFAVTPSGMLICYHFKPPTATKEKPNPSMEGAIDIVNLETVTRVFCFMHLDVGFFMSLERVFACGEDSFGILCHPEGQTVVKMFDIDLEASHDAYTISGTFIKHLVCTTSGRAIINYVAEPNELELVDLHKSFELKELEFTTGHHDPEPADILGGLPHTKRYVLFMSKDHAVCIWDLATRVCVRVVEVAFPCTHAGKVSARNLAGIDPHLCQLFICDLHGGTFALKNNTVPYKVRDANLRAGVSVSGEVVIVGPKPNTLSGVDPKTGKISWCCAVGAAAHMGGLIVSDNGKVAICEVPIDPEEEPKPKGQFTFDESKLYVFDLQIKNRLPDLKLETAKPLSTRLVDGALAFLTPDGTSYVTSATTKAGVLIVVFDTSNGTSRMIPTVRGAFEQSLGYSKTLDACVIGYTDGIIRLWHLSDLSCQEIDTGKGLVISRVFVSGEGLYAGCFFAADKNTIHVYNLDKRRKHGIYWSSEEIISCYFSGIEFLLVSRANSQGLQQLCLHTAQSNTEGSLHATSTSNRPQTASKRATGRSTPRPSSGWRPVSARRERPLSSSRRNVTTPVPQTPCLEAIYLEEMNEDRDLFGLPAKLDCLE